MASAVYFAVIPVSLVGFTDQLFQFNTLFKIGKSLDYIYHHINFTSNRSDKPVRSCWPEKSAEKNQHGILLNPICSKDNEILDFIGFKEHFMGSSDNIVPDDVYSIDVELNDVVLDEYNINTLNDLLAYVRKHASYESNEHSTVLLRLGIRGEKEAARKNKDTVPRDRLYSLINKNINSNITGYSLRKIYNNKRRHSPWESLYNNSVVKVFVHIRMGDIATVETPWNTYISLLPSKCRFAEYQRFEDIPCKRVMRISDYVNFLHKLYSQFEKEQFQTIIFSDGYKRSIKVILKNRQIVGLTKNKIQALQTSIKDYDTYKYDAFNDIDNCRSVIGEEPHKLCSFIDCLLSADIVVTSTQNRMVLKLLSLYCDSSNMPLVIILGRRETRSQYGSLGFGELANKIIFIDIEDVGYSIPLEHIGNYLPDSE